MKKKRFKCLLVYLIVMGIIFGFPITHVSADEEVRAVSMAFSWPEGSNGEVVEVIDNDYNYGDILEGSKLTVTYSDNSTKELLFTDGYFMDGEDWPDVSVNMNNWDVPWTVGTTDAEILFTYYYDYSVDPLITTTSVTIVEDTTIVSWSDVKAKSVEAVDGLSISSSSQVTFLYKDYTDTLRKITGLLVYTDVNYKQSIDIDLNISADYKIFTDDGNGGPKIVLGNGSYYSNSYSWDGPISIKNGISKNCIRYYICIIPMDNVSAVKLSVSSSTFSLFEDVENQISTLKEGNNTGLSELPMVEWYYRDRDFNYEKVNDRVVKLLIPSGKAVSLDKGKYEGWSPYTYIFDGNGDPYNNHKYTLSFEGDKPLIFDIKDYRIVNDESTDKYLYLLVSNITELTVTTHDFAYATVTVDPNFPDDMEVYEDEKEIREYDIDGEQPCLYFKSDLFNYNEQYAIAGWKNKDTGEEYPAKWIFYPEVAGKYNFEAIWEEKPYHTVIFKSNYPSEWGMTEQQLLKKVYQDCSIDIYDYGNQIKRKDGYKINQWYYLENGERKYCVNSWLEPEDNIVLYGEWTETDEVRVTVHSNYPSETGLTNIEVDNYVDPSIWYYISYSFDEPEGYRFTGWKNQTGNDSDGSGYFTKKTDLYAQWTKIYKATFHSNYPVALGFEEEISEEYDYGEGVELDWKYNAGDYSSTVYIIGWSLTKDGESVGEMSEDYYLTKDTDLYAIWEVPDTPTHTFHSQYPPSWNMIDKSVKLTVDFGGNLDMSGLAAAMPGKDGATIVGWEDEYGFEVYTEEDLKYYSWTDDKVFYAIWSTRPTVTINTNLPNEFSGMSAAQIKYYTNRAGQFNLYKFDLASSIQGYNCKLTNKKTGESYVVGEYDDQLELTASITLDAEWKPCENIRILTKYSNGEDHEQSLKTLWDGGYILPIYVYDDPITGAHMTTVWYVDEAGNKYYADEKVQVPANSYLTAVFKEINESRIRYHLNYPNGTPSGYTGLYDMSTWCNMYKVESFIRQEMAVVDGYTFAGWKDKDGNLIDESETYYTEEDVDLYGSWKSNKNGFIKEGTTWKYYVSGKLYKPEEKNGRTLVNGTINGKKNWYKVTGQGVYDPTFIGIAKDTNDKWWFVNNGVKDVTTSIVAQATNGIWYYVKKGVIDRAFSGKLVLATNGKWYYVNKGKPTKTFTGKIAQTTDGKWYYCTDGKPDVKFSGKLAYCTNGDWYYVTKGKINKTFTGVVEATNGSWYYCVKGKMNKTFTGIAKATNGKYYYVNKGKQDLKYKGIAKTSDGKMYYVSKGEIDRSFTGNCKYNGKTYKVVKGVVK